MERNSWSGLTYPQSEVQSIFLPSLAESDGLTAPGLVRQTSVERGRATRLAARVQRLGRERERENQ